MALPDVRNSLTARNRQQTRSGAATGESPPMYEMEGPRPACRPQPAGYPAWCGRRSSPPAWIPGRETGLPVPRRSGVSPGSVSACGSDEFLLPLPGLAQGVSAWHSQDFLDIHRTLGHYPLLNGAYPHRGPQAKGHGAGRRSVPGLPAGGWVLGAGPARPARRARPPSARLPRPRGARRCAVTARVLMDAASALMRHNRWRYYTNEAPPCMRWRGLARSHSPACRLLSCRSPDCCPLPTRPLAPAPSSGNPVAQLSLRSGRSPGEFRSRPQNSRASPGSVSALGGECFSTASPRSAQGLCVINLKILWPSTGHLALSPALPLLSTVYPPARPHAGPQLACLLVRQRSPVGAGGAGAGGSGRG
jgi:hypothetical protein